MVDKTGSVLWDIDNVPQPILSLGDTFLKIDATGNTTWSFSKVTTYTTDVTYESGTLILNDRNNKVYLVLQDFTATGDVYQDLSIYATPVSPKYNQKSMYFEKVDKAIVYLKVPNPDRDRKVRVLEVFGTLEKEIVFVLANTIPKTFNTTDFFGKLDYGFMLNSTQTILMIKDLFTGYYKSTSPFDKTQYKYRKIKVA
jgi:hypothetical protein